MVLAALYVPSLFVATAIMTEQLFVVLHARGARRWRSRSRTLRIRYRLAVAAGLLTGLAVLTRPNGMILLVPLAFAAWRSSWRVGGDPRRRHAS